MFCPQTPAASAKLKEFGSPTSVRRWDWQPRFAHALLQVAHARTALTGQNEKMEMLYTYLSGPQFKQRIEAIVESFATMKTDLDGERRAMEKLWARREKQIERVLRHTAGLHGDLQAIVGASLPAVTMLELSPSDTNSQEPSNNVR